MTNCIVHEQKETLINPNSENMAENIKKWCCNLGETSKYMFALYFNVIQYSIIRGIIMFGQLEENISTTFRLYYV